MDDLLRAIKATKDIKDDIPSQIEEGLYLGSVEAANNKALLKSLNITHILTVASSVPPAYPNDFTYKTFDSHDRGDVNIAQFFDDCFGFISEAKRTGNVLVHCFAGRSRSVTVVVAYMMKTHGMSSYEALNLVKRKRSVAAPNAGFILQLQSYEKSLPVKSSAFRNGNVHRFLVAICLWILTPLRLIWLKMKMHLKSG
ncbi:putative phosphoric monoester hydrolase [Helianthus annuus]|nr:putative phosphoric monoester hydrolase [Helianthus annuus]KAJ0895644.1 putative phosphoric monoester hydrolase [Helianthus annuus]